MTFEVSNSQTITKFKDTQVMVMYVRMIVISLDCYPRALDLDFDPSHRWKNRGYGGDTPLLTSSQLQQWCSRTIKQNAYYLVISLPIANGCA